MQARSIALHFSLAMFTKTRSAKFGLNSYVGIAYKNSCMYTELLRLILVKVITKLKA